MEKIWRTRNTRGPVTTGKVPVRAFLDYREPILDNGTFCSDEFPRIRLYASIRYLRVCSRS